MVAIKTAGCSVFVRERLFLSKMLRAACHLFVASGPLQKRLRVFDLIEYIQIKHGPEIDLAPGAM
jgi:hypothetical protein